MGSLIASALSVIWLIFLGSHYLDVGRNAIARPPSSDFYKFYLSAHRVDAGLSMYWLVPSRLKKGDPCHPDTPETAAAAKLDRTPSRLNVGGELPCLGPNLNPPIFTALMLPLSRLPYAQAWWIWSSFSIVCAAVFALLLAYEFGKSRLERLLWAPIACAVVFTYYPTLASFSLGQLGSPLALFLLLSWRSARNANEMQASLWLGVVLAIKPIFGVLWLGLLATKRWRFAIWSAACALTLSALGVIFFGVQAVQDYVQVAGNVHWTAANWNASWFGLFDRAYSGQASSNWPADRVLSKTLGLIFATATLAASAWVLQRYKHAPRELQIGAVFTLGLPTTLLASPLGWMYYFPAFLISYFTLVQWHLAEEHKQYQLPLILIGVMTMIPVGLKPSPSPENPTTWYGMDSWYWLCAITLWIVVAWALLARPQTREGAEAPSL